ncbi:KilA-N domain-containing protein [Pseudoduganella violacea]|uniref:KilA-N domain-containing protein n=1 Tax=Pseudoduganella violacea TaxID=1715466 RepID=A0A7W5B8J4_9BURK|nr:KilA-N domain-containing protein [Pseudoduganella violacea]MBB3118376.1 hypothetical protein [Pseudoduganella violacea]
MSNQLTLALIPHETDGSIIDQRAVDGYINATALCKASGKNWSDYRRNSNTIAFLVELEADLKMPTALLIHTNTGGDARTQGTWVHPQVAINLGQWLSAKFAVQVTKWVYEWMSGGIRGGMPNTMPVHLQRYMANRAEIPATHFSILNELTFGLIAPLESGGYTLPEGMVPDISEGKMFSAWIRKEKGVNPADFPSYQHRYTDGRVVSARLYPNEYLADFRAHFNTVWLPQKAAKYFADRDVKALQYLPKLLAGPSK